jgi:excinuclease ABC subunit A
MDKLRALYAATPGARMRGFKPGRFSFNAKGGRCEGCEGRGAVLIEMHFLPDVWIGCDVCGGRRYAQEVLEVRFKGHSIADVLSMRIDRAVEIFTNQRSIRRALQALVDVGLGYLSLGQPATTLSGGESQRVKLASELTSRKGHCVYVLDEPTTGLHLADIARLVDVLHTLVDQGHTVITIEHHLDLLWQADWIVDLGPEGGVGGGRVVATGPPAVVATSDGATGRALAALQRPPAPPAGIAGNPIDDGVKPGGQTPLVDTGPADG